MTRNGTCGNCSLSTASTCGMPLPAAWGEMRRTSEAAIPAAAAQAPIKTHNPSGPWACAKTTSASRSWSACSSRSMKQATPAPEITPTTSARTVRSAENSALAFRFVAASQFRNHSQTAGFDCQMVKANRSQKSPVALMRLGVIVSSPAALRFIRTLTFEPTGSCGSARQKRTVRASKFVARPLVLGLTLHDEGRLGECEQKRERQEAEGLELDPEVGRLRAPDDLVENGQG